MLHFIANNWLFSNPYLSAIVPDKGGRKYRNHQRIVPFKNFAFIVFIFND